MEDRTVPAVTTNFSAGMLSLSLGFNRNAGVIRQRVALLALWKSSD
jgi:hypothetical protein